jgi:hypothetical protein
VGYGRGYSFGDQVLILAAEPDARARGVVVFATSPWVCDSGGGWKGTAMIAGAPGGETGSRGLQGAPSSGGNRPLQVASARRCAYGPLMSAGAGTRWPARAVQLLMLVLGVVATPSVGLDAMQRPHCAQHELAVGLRAQRGAPAPVAHGPSQAAWAQQHDHGCHHCPASECARVSPCAGPVTIALVPSRAVVYDLQSHRVALDLDRQQARSAVSPPEPPPPQLIA